MADALTDQLRLLTKLIPGFTGSSDGGDLTLTTTREGWQTLPVNDSQYNAFVWRGYLDLAGYDAEQLTLFIQGIQISESAPFSGLLHSLVVGDYVTKVYLTDDDLNVPYLGTSQLYPVGFGASNHDMEQVMLGRIRNLYHDSGWTLDNLLQTSSVNQWGEGTATAGARLYLTRIVIVSSDSAAVVVPDACYQVACVATEEADLEYVMRLRRDYELAPKE